MVASRPQWRPSVNISISNRDRWRRRIVMTQGIYYVLTGLWPLLHFESFADLVGVRIIPFQAHAFSAVIVVVGGFLFEAARREPPSASPTLLGITIAAAIALISLFWLPRMGVFSGLWLDLPIEVAFAVSLILFYPRQQADRGRVTRRR